MNEGVGCDLKHILGVSTEIIHSILQQATFSKTTNITQNALFSIVLMENSMLLLEFGHFLQQSFTVGWLEVE